MDLLISYPPDLPVSGYRKELLQAISAHQVVIVAGETGSGKTTQLPKMCLELGRGACKSGRGPRIAHTQPRRLAARSVAERIAVEIGEKLGDTVGYSVRHHRKMGPDTRLEVMTDGMLLAALQHDRDLRAYDTIIIDEAHERSLNIDMLLGHCGKLLRKRPDLRVIITSATIDVERFAAHYQEILGVEVPIITVEGRTYPVEVRYQPLERPQSDGQGGQIMVPCDQTTGIVDAVRQLWAAHKRGSGPEDVLVFCSGEREINDAVEALSEKFPQAEIIPLFARLAVSAQRKVFSRGDRRRIVVATNVAETSLTVPGIGYVVDAGTARISRMSQRTKVQRLPIEPISQASANQRSGRAGRLAPGVAVRLYSETDFLSRPQFTDPEVLRTNLANVLLSMIGLRLGSIESFPWIDPPDSRAVHDGLTVLRELGAITAGSPPRLTKTGRVMSHLAVDPRLARMLVEADRLGVLAPVLVLVAGLSIQDVRLRPPDNLAAADTLHARFRQPGSDFLSMLALWEHLSQQRQNNSRSAFRRLLKTEFLHHLRVREWQDLRASLRIQAREAGLKSAERLSSEQESAQDQNLLASNDAETVHKAVLAGLLSHIGVWEEKTRSYRGARGVHFMVQPGSSLHKQTPPAVMAAELVETTRTWARMVAQIDPTWAEKLAGHLVRRSYSDPVWKENRGAAMMQEKVTLFGVILVAGRPVNAARIDPELARDMFLRYALVEGKWRTYNPIILRNWETQKQVHDWQDRLRGDVFDQQAAWEWYDQRVPKHIVSGASFERWWKKSPSEQKENLVLRPENVVRKETYQRVAQVDTQYPVVWSVGEFSAPISYEFTPGKSGDGATINVPIASLPAAPDMTPLLLGNLLALTEALLRSLPKPARRLLVPVPDTAAAAMKFWQQRDQFPTHIEQLCVDLGEFLRGRGVSVASSDFRLAAVPQHLLVDIRVHDEQGESVVTGTDMGELKRSLAGRVGEVLSQAQESFSQTGLSDWPQGEHDGQGKASPLIIPAQSLSLIAGTEVEVFPTLVDQGKKVDLTVSSTQAEAEAELVFGVRRLVSQQMKVPVARILGMLDPPARLALAVHPASSGEQLVQSLVYVAVSQILDTDLSSQSVVRDEPSFRDLCARTQSCLHPTVLQLLRSAAEACTVWARTQPVLAALSPQADPWILEIAAQSKAGFARILRSDMGLAPWQVSAHGGRYARALELRLQQGPTALDRDYDRWEQWEEAEKLWQQARSVDLGPEARLGLLEVEWLLEEFMVSLFAQKLGTAHSVSLPRIKKAIADLS